MATYNRVILAGNLANDPELRFTQQGTPVSDFVLAVNRPRSATDAADFIRITVFGDDAETVANYKRKGHGVQVEGRLDHQSWQAQDGSTRSAVKVIARKGGVQFLPQRSAISVNKVFLIGNLTRDPELVKVGADDILKANFGIAVNGLRRGGEEEEEPEADFFGAVAWRGLADVIGKYKEKGHPIHLTGRLQYSAWETDGQKKSKVEVVAEDVQFLPSQKKKKKAAVAAGAPGESEEPDPFDDDLPF